MRQNLLTQEKFDIKERERERRRRRRRRRRKTLKRIESAIDLTLIFSIHQIFFFFLVIEMRFPIWVKLSYNFLGIVCLLG